MLIYDAYIECDVYAGILASVSKHKHIACRIVSDTDMQVDVIFVGYCMTILHRCCSCVLQ